MAKYINFYRKKINVQELPLKVFGCCVTCKTLQDMWLHVKNYCTSAFKFIIPAFPQRQIVETPSALEQKEWQHCRACTHTQSLLAAVFHLLNYLKRGQAHSSMV